MAVFMEGRMKVIAGLSLASWLFGNLLPMISMLLQNAAAAVFCWYCYLLYKTLKAAVVVPIFWGYVAQLVVSRYLTRDEFFRADAPPEEIAKKREEALSRMSKSWKQRWAKAAGPQKYIKRHFSDLRFKASGFECMYPIWQEVVNEALDPFTIVESSEGMTLTDTSGEKFLDVSGSYGVNCFGYTKTKEFLEAGFELTKSLGPCLGPMHPIVAENLEMLLTIFNKEEASFHMSGTEAIMSAVYQARFHTQRRVTAVFQGTYHGWWDGVMQGAGNDRFVGDCIILKDQCEESLELLRVRANEISALIVNPISGFGWKNAGTNKLTTSNVTAGAGPMDKFKAWLLKVRKTCTECDIPLIFDETWCFHLGAGGSQELYGVDPDLLVLGKSIGGGHAAGVVLGPSRLMERRDVDRPMRVNFVVGTFKGNPVSMGAMNAVLKYVTTPEAKKSFDGLRDRVDKWVGTCNSKLDSEDLPIRVAAYRTTWCICYQFHSPYNFLFMYYLRDAGLQMAWVGTGKMLFTLEFSDADLSTLTDILIKAGQQFKEDGWWFEGSKPVNLLPLIIGPTINYHLGALKRKLGFQG